MADLAVHDDRSGRSRWPDLRVHDGPKFAADTYAVQPRLVPIVFAANGVEGAFSNQDGAITVNYWRGNNTTVMIWSYSFLIGSGCPVYIFSDPGIKEVLRVAAENENAQRKASEKAMKDRKSAISF